MSHSVIKWRPLRRGFSACISQKVICLLQISDSSEYECNVCSVSLAHVHLIPNNENPFKTAERVRHYLQNRDDLLLLPVDSGIAALDSSMMGYHENAANILDSLCLLFPTLISLRNTVFGKASNDFNLCIDMKSIRGAIRGELFRSNIRRNLWNIIYFVDTHIFVDVLNEFLAKYAVNGSLIHRQIQILFDEHRKIIRSDPSSFESFFRPELYQKSESIEELLFGDFLIDVWIEIIMKLIIRYKLVMLECIHKWNDSLHPMTDTLVHSMDLIGDFGSNRFGLDAVNALSANISKMRIMFQSMSIYKILRETMINPIVPRNVHLFIEQKVIEFMRIMHRDKIHQFFSQMLLFFNYCCGNSSFGIYQVVNSSI